MRPSKILVAPLTLAALGALACGASFEPNEALAKGTPTADLEIEIDLEVGEPIMIAEAPGKAYVKLSITGFEPPRTVNRAPINLALVIDRSSSMSGDKIVRAKEAAVMVLDSLRPHDIISVITYDSTVDVLVPATRADDRGDIRQRIMSLSPRGSTALFSGVSHGIQEARKFKTADRVNRIILLSDGRANVGPSSPAELGRLGEQAGRQGISITTIGLGLGYNEDLMANLAQRSDGNHAFAEHADHLATIFRSELGDITSVVARDIDIEIEFDGHVRPVRGLNRDLSIRNNKAKLRLNQIYAGQEKFVLIEVDVPANKAGSQRKLASAKVGYRNLITKKRNTRRDSLRVSFSDSRSKVQKSENKVVMVAANQAIAVRENARAVALRDSGKVNEAREVLNRNSFKLEQQARRYKSKKLSGYAKKNKEDAKHLDKPSWNKQRKVMVKEQYTFDNNMSF